MLSSLANAHTIFLFTKMRNFFIFVERIGISSRVTHSLVCQLIIFSDVLPSLKLLLWYTQKYNYNNYDDCIICFYLALCFFSLHMPVLSLKCVYNKLYEEQKSVFLRLGFDELCYGDWKIKSINVDVILQIIIDAIKKKEKFPGNIIIIVWFCDTKIHEILCRRI